VIFIDPTVNGSIDDGTEGGVLRTKEAFSGLVPIPLHQIYISKTNGGTGTNYVNINPDYNFSFGSGGGQVQCKTDAYIDNYATIRFQFSGKIIGINMNSDTADMSLVTVFVDGVCYPLRKLVQTMWLGGIAVTYKDESTRFIIADDLLDDGPHQAEIHFVGNPSAAHVYVILAILLERRVGYLPREQSAQVIGSYALANATPVLPVTFLNRLASPNYIVGIDFVNTTAAPITVSIKYLNTNLIFQSVVGAYSTVSWKPPMPMPAVSWTVSTALTITGDNGLNIISYGY
jgi:hypothetical protein